MSSGYERFWRGLATSRTSTSSLPETTAIAGSGWRRPMVSIVAQGAGHAIRCDSTRHAASPPSAGLSACRRRSRSPRTSYSRIAASCFALSPPSTGSSPSGRISAPSTLRQPASRVSSGCIGRTTAGAVLALPRLQSSGMRPAMSENAEKPPPAAANRLLAEGFSINIQSPWYVAISGEPRTSARSRLTRRNHGHVRRQGRYRHRRWQGDP